MNVFERRSSLDRDGDSDDQRWTSWESGIDHSLSSRALFQQVWDDSCELYSADFVAYIETNSDDRGCGTGGRQRHDTRGTPVAVPAQQP